MRTQPPDQTQIATTATSDTATAPWNIRAASVDLEKFNLLLTDLSLAKKPQMTISDVHFHAENLSFPVAEKSPFSLTAQIGEKGRIQVDGSAIHTPLQLQAQTEITALPLVSFNNFVPENLNFNLKDGKFYSTLGINLKQQPDKLSGNFSGKVNIANFDLRDPTGSGELLGWDNLSFAGIEGEIAPLSLHISDVVLNHYLANIQITPEGTGQPESLNNRQTGRQC